MRSLYLAFFQYKVWYYKMSCERCGLGHKLAVVVPILCWKIPYFQGFFVSYSFLR